MADNTEIKVKSIKKTIDVLNCFIEKQPLGVTEISEKLGLYKSNVHGILSTLTALDYLSKDEETGKYYLGVGILRLSQALGDRYSFQKVAAAHMQALSNQVGEIVYLSVPFKDQVYYLDAAFPSDGAPYLIGSVRSTTDYMHCTSCGKAMLAYMPKEYLEQYLAKPLEAPTPNTITDPSALLKELQRIRERGYATDNMEAMIGISCVAVPIRDGKGEALGALSISGPSPRFTQERIQQLASLLKEHVDAIHKAI